MALPAPSILSETSRHLSEMINSEVSGRPKVSIGPPSDAEPKPADTDPSVNLFMYRFEPSGFYPDATNQDPWPIRAQMLITAYATTIAEDDADIGSAISGGEINLRLLGAILQLFHTPVGITIIVSLVVDPNYFQSEIRAAAEQALGRGPGGLFEPGRLRFGEDLFVSDLIATLMALDGVQNVCLIRFKRTGHNNPDQSEPGRIALEGLELAVCDNDPALPERGYFTIRTHGGRRG